MDVKYKNNLMDIMSLYKHQIKLFPNNIIIVILPLVFVLKIMKIVTDNFSNVDFVSFFIFIITYTLVVYIYILIYVLAMLLFTIVNINQKNSKGLLGEHRLSFNNSKFIEETDFNRTEVVWEGIFRYFVTRKYIYIYLNKVQAFIIPKKELKNDEIERIIKFLKDKNIVGK